MRTRIGILVAYLLLGCILLEDAFPYFASMDTHTLCEAKTESEEKEAKKEKETVDEWSDAKERLQTSPYRAFACFLNHEGSLIADSDEIPDSAHQRIFSPPPERV